MKTVKHYFVLGCYLGFFAALLAIARALSDLPGKLKGTQVGSVELLLIAGGIVLVAGVIVLFGGLLGGLAGRLKLNAEERARARKESLIVRR